MTTTAIEPVTGVAHWVTKQHTSGAIRLSAWERFLPSREGSFVGTILLVHGSSMAATPVYDLQLPGSDQPSMMEHFAQLGFDVWCFDCEGYGRSDKSRDSKFPVSDGADDAEAVGDYICRLRGVDSLLVYGGSSGALRAAMWAERRPERVKRLVLDAFVWTGRGAPTLEQRRKRLPEWLASNRRPVNPEFIRTIFSRDHPGIADPEVVEAFAQAVCELDDTIPNGTYVDMCQNLPLMDPRNLRVPVLITRGQYDGIASMEDLLEYFALLPNHDKQFAVMAGSAHASVNGKNQDVLFHLLNSFWTQPAPAYLG